jgi:hypothetical protein
MKPTLLLTLPLLVLAAAWWLSAYSRSAACGLTLAMSLERSQGEAKRAAGYRTGYEQRGNHHRVWTEPDPTDTSSSS